MPTLTKIHETDTLAFFALAVYLVIHLYHVLKNGQLVAINLDDR